MAGTRNKQMYNDFCISQRDQLKHADWITTETVTQIPAYPCSGINVQRMPANRLSSNSIDVEAYLYGIGSNNYIFPVSTPSPAFTPLQSVTFAPIPNLYLPRLPPFLQNQRP